MYSIQSRRQSNFETKLILSLQDRQGAATVLLISWFRLAAEPSSYRKHLPPQNSIHISERIVHVFVR